MEYMKIEDLAAIGAFVPDAPEDREVEWKYTANGEAKAVTMKVSVLRLPFSVIEEIGNKYKSHVLGSIVEGVMFDNGQTKLTLQQAEKLHPDLVLQLIKAFNEVNRTGEAQGT